MSVSRCRTVVAYREGAMCARCGRPGQSYHHRKKRSQGGEWTASNIVLLCGSGTTGDHGWVEEHPDAAELEGYHVRPWQNPADVPIKIWGTWCLLLADGTKDETREEEELAPENGDALRPRISRQDAEMQTQDQAV